MVFKRTILPNGLRLITVPMKDNPSVTVMVLVEAGSKYENKNNNGVSHFLEHMVFKGTENRPITSQISYELDGLGAQHNAFTSLEVTGYWAKIQKKYMENAFDIISDMYLNPIFPDTEIDKEKGVILGEINLDEDMPMRNVGRIFMNLLYGDQPAGMSILGEKENIKLFTRNDFVKYRKKHYVPQSTTIVVSGSFDYEEVLKLSKEKFLPMSKGKKAPKVKVKTKQLKPKIAVKHKKTDQTHLLLGFHSYPANHKNLTALELLDYVLGRGMSSRLFRKLRDEMGLGYYVKSTQDSYTDHGDFSVAAGVDNARLEEAVKAILEECKKLKTGLIPEAELKKAKRAFVGNMYLNMEGSDDLGQFFGFQEIMRLKIKTPKEIEKEVKKVSAEDIQKVANEIFRNNSLNLAVIGPVRNKKKLLSLLKI